MVRKFSKCMLATFFILSVLMIVSMARADTPKVGVNVGDWSTYSLDMWAGTSHFVETLKVEVTHVIATAIYYSVTWDPPVSNDTTNPQLNVIFTNAGCIDLLTGMSSGSYLGYFIAVNGSGTTIGGTDYAISRTEPHPMQYLGQSFEITHMSGSGTGIQEDLYWIRSTGVLTELEISGSGFSMTMLITSMVPEFTTPLLLLVLVATTLPATMVILRKKFKRTANPSIDRSEL